jgi:hypothetical protein
MAQDVQDALDAQAYRTVNVSITNSSGTECDVLTFSLTGGSWQTPPQAGQPILPGATQNYVNFTDAAFTALGGTIALLPTTGGTLTIVWNWPWGGMVTGSATAAGVTGVAVSANVINPNTSSPTLQVSISNAATTTSGGTTS